MTEIKFEKHLFYWISDEKGCRLIEITEQEAIRLQRNASIQITGKDVYSSDKQALEDFMVINWTYAV